MEKIFPEIINLHHAHILIFSHLSGREILKFREVNKYSKYWIDKNLNYIYKQKRQRNKLYINISLLDDNYLNNLRKFKEYIKLFAFKILKKNNFLDYTSADLSRVMDDENVFIFLSHFNSGMSHYQATKILFDSANP